MPPHLNQTCLLQNLSHRPMKVMDPAFAPPSAITMFTNPFRGSAYSWRFTIFSMSYGISGIKQAWRTACNCCVRGYNQPASRPCFHDHGYTVVAFGRGLPVYQNYPGGLIWAAVWKPNVMSVAKWSLSIWFGTPTIGSSQTNFGNLLRAIATNIHNRIKL